jgi:hypothetical protein
MSGEDKNRTALEKFGNFIDRHYQEGEPDMLVPTDLAYEGMREARLAVEETRRLRRVVDMLKSYIFGSDLERCIECGEYVPPRFNCELVQDKDPCRHRNAIPKEEI